MKRFLALSLSDVVFIVLINVKIVGILTFMNRIISCSAELSIESYNLGARPQDKRASIKIHFDKNICCGYSKEASQ